MRRGRSRRHPVGRAVLWLANAAEALAGLAAAAALGAVVLTLPRTNDTAEIPGLSAPVSVGFDSDGIARIRATTELDGAAAIGFVHARDRMFQMELMRRAAAGTISELAGPRALPLDRTMRVLGVRYRAEQELAALPADTRAMLDAYARGVNAWLAQHGRFSSLQSVVLGRPAPWSALDSLLWGKTLGLYLSGNWREELARAGLLDRGAPRDKIDQLWPPQDDTPGPSASAAQPGEAIYAALLDRLIPSFPDPFTLPSTASNEWAVDGAHSTTGAPLLAGDPHLAYSKPGIWYLARIDTPTSTLVGATAPGVPFLVIGRNRDIAWTFTTAGADTQDVFIEQPLPDRRYQTPTGPAAFTTRTERIGVRGEPDQVLTVRETRHGPVVSDIAGAGGPVYAAAIASLQPDDDAATGLLAINRARTVAEAGLAAPIMTSPVQNLLVADKTGIGQFTTGRVPVRKAGDGEWPVDGADGAHDWVGWASGTALPHVVNPASGRIVNGNERTAPPSFPVFMGKDSFGDWRAQRVRQLLGNDKHSVADFSLMQVDVTSTFATAMLPFLLARPLQPGIAGQAAATLAHWDGSMEMDVPQPLIFNAWVQRFGALVLERNRLPANASRPWADWVAWLLRTGGSGWCGDGGCGPVLDQALQQSVAGLAKRFGPDPAAWRWGVAHDALFADPIVPLFNRFIPQPGDDTTIFRGGWGPGSFTALHGPGYRGVYDLSDGDRSRFIITPGQSGHPFSRHAADLMQRWRDGDGLAIEPSSTQLEDTLALRPQQGD